MFKFVSLLAVLAVANAGYVPHTITSQSDNILRSPGNLAQISTFSKTIDTPYSSVRKSDVRISNPGVYAHAAPVVSYAAPAVSYAAPALSYAHAAPAVAYSSAPALSYAHAAPAVAYSSAPAVSHVSFSSAPVAYRAAPAVSYHAAAPAALAYSSAPAVSYSYAPSYAAHAVGSSHQSTVRSLDGNSAVSHYSKAVDTAFSSVRKYDTRITNDAKLVSVAPALSYAAPALSYSATPVVAHANFAGLGAHYAW